MGRPQREKGKRGERLAAKALSDLGFPARRGVQFQGGPQSPDILAKIAGVHWEVKFVEREQVRSWVAQAKEDSGGKVPVVLHKRSRGEWLLTIPLGRLNEFTRRLEEARDSQVQEVGPAELPG
jgi:Holliday junction resolvase